MQTLEIKAQETMLLSITIGRFQKISIPIPQTAFRISEGEGGSLNWNSEEMGGIYDWKSEGMGGFHRGISGVERVSEFLENAIVVDFCSS